MRTSALLVPLGSLVSNVPVWSVREGFANLRASTIHLSRCTPSWYQVRHSHNDHLDIADSSDYVMGHFNLANVESFVAKNATGWGTQHLLVRLTWGYRRLLEANVVALTLRSTSSDMGFQHQAFSNGSGRPTLLRKQSPPLGIPLGAMEELEDVYSQYIRDIVQSDLREYVSIAYDDQDSYLPEHLLGAVCSYYIKGLEADEEVSSRSNFCVVRN